MSLDPLATVEDVETAWRDLDDTERGQAEHVLRLASRLVRAEVHAVDARIARGDLDPMDVTDVVVAIAKRVLNNPDNARGRSRTAGPYTEYTQWDAATSSLSLLPVELRMLAPPLRRAAGIGTVRLAAGLGWPPTPQRPLPPTPPPGGGVRP